MFSFHKPKVYRSNNGCCICCAKSSSSRFTDSRKYEIDFYKCFRILEPRTGEICNACVLLVKRWQKLPPGSNRNWNHVVDARAGPGSKSVQKMKSKAELVNKKHKYKSPADRSLHNAARHNREQCIQEDIEDLHVKKTRSSVYQPPPSPTFSDNSDDMTENKKLLAGSKISSFLDLTYWKCTQVCCGIIFKGPLGEIMVDPSLLRPCQAHKQKTSTSLSSVSQSDRHSDGESNHSNESSRDTNYDAVARDEDSSLGDQDDEETDCDDDDSMEEFDDDDDDEDDLEL